MSSLKSIIGERLAEDLLEELAILFQQLQVLGWKQLRPWNEFFAVFKTPQFNWKHLELRVTTNFLQYRSNYLFICGIIFLLRMIISPWIIFALSLVIFICIFVLFVYKKPIKIGDLVVTQQIKYWFCLVVSFLILVLTGTLERLLWSFIYCILICGLHLIFRPRSISAKANKIHDEIKLNSSSFGFFQEANKNSSYIDPENPVQNDNEIITQAMHSQQNISAARKRTNLKN